MWTFNLLCIKYRITLMHNMTTTWSNLYTTQPPLVRISPSKQNAQPWAQWWPAAVVLFCIFLNQFNQSPSIPHLSPACASLFFLNGQIFTETERGNWYGWKTILCQVTAQLYQPLQLCRSPGTSSRAGMHVLNWRFEHNLTWDWGSTIGSPGCLISHIPKH